MSPQTINSTEEFRLERKFLVHDFTSSQIEQLLKYHPAAFKELYHERKINNIYFDTLGFESYYGNVEGDTERSKARIRWYGETFGTVNHPVLEFKIKKGLLGKKKSFKLSPFIFDANFSKQQIIEALNTENVPLQIRNQMLAMQPALLNNYIRKYFISADKQFRLTIDKQLTFYRISYFGNQFINKITDFNSVVVELKYNSANEIAANEITTKFPFAITKSSKYLQGIEKILF